MTRNMLVLALALLPAAASAQTINESAICDGVTSPVPTERQFEGRLVVFRDLDPETGMPVSGGDELFALLQTFGTRLWILKSKGPVYTEDFASGHPYSLYEVVTDEPADPSDRSGSFKEEIGLYVQRAWTQKTIAAA